MSFEWNQLSDDEPSEEIDFDKWVNDQVDGTVGHSTAFFTQNSDDDMSWASGESVNWEDAASEASGNKKPAALESRFEKKITINLETDEDVTSEPRRRRKKSRKMFRNEVLPLDLQSFLWELHHAHLLCLTSRGMNASMVCSEEVVLGVAHSLIPEKWTMTSNLSFPALKQVREFAEWYFQWIHSVEERRSLQTQANRRAGAPMYRPIKRTKHSLHRKHAASATSELPHSTLQISSVERMLQFSSYLSKVNDENPQLLNDQPFLCSGSDVVQLFTAMCRSLEWRCRYVQVLHPVSVDLHVHHPLLQTSQNLFQLLAKNAGREADAKTSSKTSDFHSPPSMAWVEVLCTEKTGENGNAKYRWVPIDPVNRLFDVPDQVEILLYQKSNESKSTKRRVHVSYVLSVEGGSRGLPSKVADVTPRYSSSWIASLKQRGVTMKGKVIRNDSRVRWWQDTLSKINNRISLKSREKAVPSLTSGKTMREAITVDEDLEVDRHKSTMEDVVDFDERQELHDSSNNEALPTSKVGFKSHPLFVLQSQLSTSEVLAPDSNKRICGVFKGELVYRRTDVSVALPEKKWLYKGRKVRESEVAHPIKRIKARKKPLTKKFVALQSYSVGKGNDGSEERRQQDMAEASNPLDDGTEALYAVWQTESWNPVPVGPTDEIPINEYKNVELALLNPGLVHVRLQGAAALAKKLGIPYAPCLVGFEGHGGNRTPSIRGIVVHAHNEQLIREATTEATNYEIQEREDERKRRIRSRWKKLMVGILTEERLKKDYS